MLFGDANGEIISMVINNCKQSVIVFDGETARKLLRLGYTIIDVKPDKRNKIKSVFVFRYENDIDKAIATVNKEDIF